MKTFYKIWLMALSLILVTSMAFIINANKPNTNINNTMKTENLKEAYFAWGCFWCMEGIFESQDWIKEAISWYLWWDEETANYESVSKWKTKHREWVKIIYDPDKIFYNKLVELFWTQIDPTDEWWQFADRWYQYTTAIFYQNDLEKNIATNSKESLNESGKFQKEIVTKIEKFINFYEAESYHQDYYKKNSLKYKAYSNLSWRESYKEKTWKDYKFSNNNLAYQDYSEDVLSKATQEHIVLFFHAPWCPSCNAFEEKVISEEIPEDILILKVDFDSNRDLRQKYNILTQTSFALIDWEWNLVNRWIWSRWINDIIDKISSKKRNKKVYSKEELKSMLTPLQYKVTQEWGTEPPFDNKYWDNYEEWIYVDVIDWTPLFSSTDKFDSGTWWPSFTKTIDENIVSEKTDTSYFMVRTEVKAWKSHLWHVFNDWPKDKWWLRYCINSAALKFIAKEDMEKEWYWKYLFLFE